MPLLPLDGPGQTRSPWPGTIAFTIYAVRISIRTNDVRLLEEISEYLPDERKPSAAATAHCSYVVLADAQALPGPCPPRSQSRIQPDSAGVMSWGLASGQANGGNTPLYHLFRGPAHLLTGGREEVLFTLESDLNLYVAARAQRRLFVHAGVVGWKDAAIVVPGPSFSGKTSLVYELVKSGATYYSDEYAVLDLQGRVHPFPRPLSIRNGEGGGRRRVRIADHPAERRPLAVRLVAVCSYEKGGSWQPRRLTAGAAMLSLLANTVPARRNPRLAMAVLSRVVETATALGGVRGEARDVIEALLV